MTIRPNLFENAILILLTALLGGLFVPIIKSKMDQARFREQRVFEQELYIQAERIKTQTKFLDELALALWEFQLLATEPAHLRLQGNTESGEDSSKKYDERALTLLTKIRSQVGQARTLASPVVYEKLMKLYQELSSRIDPWLNRLEQNKESSVEDWKDYQSFITGEIVEQIEDLLNFLTRELGLARPKEG